MPELPECETIVRGLQPLVGETIQIVVTDAVKGLIKNISHELFKSTLKDASILSIERSGKWIEFQLDNDFTLLSHLGMHGSWRLDPLELEPRHTRLAIYTESHYLVYCDMRSWGRLMILDKRQAVEWLSRLGPDALLVEYEYLSEVLKRDKRSIVDILLDQSVLSGIGNIYRSEILWLARIHPTRPGTDLVAREIRVISDCCRVVLRAAILAQGSSLRDYVDVKGQPGKAQFVHAAYSRKSLPCMRCGESTLILRGLAADGRKTFYCDNCQL